MTKREEIREAIDAYTDDICLYQDNPCEFQSGSRFFKKVYCCDNEGLYRCLMKRLGDIGVVLKADIQQSGESTTLSSAPEYVAVIPLVEVKDD